MSARDVVVVGIVIFISAIVILIAHFTMTTTLNKMLSVPVINDSAPTRGALNDWLNLGEKYDKFSLYILIGLVLMVVIFSYLLDASPLFFGIYIIFWIIGEIVSFFLSNFWEVFYNNPALAVSYGAFPITNHILINLPFYLAGIGMLGLIILYAKPSYSGYGGQY